MKIWNDLDCKHLKGVCIVNILRILLKYIPGLKHFEYDFDSFRKKFMKQTLPVQKAEIIPLQTLGNDEAMTLGNHQTIRNIIDSQLMIKPEALTSQMIPISGDQATILCIRMLKWQMTSGSSAYSSNQYILPLIEEWHKLFAFLKGIMSAHYADLGVQGDQGLHWAAEKLGRKFNPKKVDFYPAEQLVEVVLTTITLSNIRYGLPFVNSDHC